MRRRLRNRPTGTTQYTFARSNDDAASFGRPELNGASIAQDLREVCVECGRSNVDAASFGGADVTGAAIAQDWRDLGAEWGRSSFDERHVLTAQFEYTTGMGAGGGALMTGKKGSLYKGWTVTGQLNLGSGLPL